MQVEKRPGSGHGLSWPCISESSNPGFDMKAEAEAAVGTSELLRWLQNLIVLRVGRDLASSHALIDSLAQNVAGARLILLSIY